MYLRPYDYKHITIKGLEQLEVKWCGYCNGGGRKTFVMYDNRSCMRNICSKINLCLEIKPLVVSLTYLADLQTGKRGDGDRIWL